MQDSLTITLGVTLFALMDFSEIKTRIYLNELHSKISNSKTNTNNNDNKKYGETEKCTGVEGLNVEQ